MSMWRVARHVCVFAFACVSCVFVCAWVRSQWMGASVAPPLRVVYGIENNGKFLPLLILFCKLFDSLKSRIPVKVEH